MSVQPPLIPYLRNVQLWVWLGIIGGALVLAAIVLGISATDPGTPAHYQIGWGNAWLFLFPLAMVAYGVYVSARYWRCPDCGWALPTKDTIPVCCRRCGSRLRSFAFRSREELG